MLVQMCMRDRVSNAAGIERQEANQKITVSRTLAAGSRPAGESIPVDAAPAGVLKGLPFPILAAMTAGGISIILLISLLFLNRRRWKAELESKEAALAELSLIHI